MASRPPRTICTAWLPVSAPSARVKFLVCNSVPQPLGAAAGQRVLLLDGAAQPDHVLGGVAALDAGPAGVVGPLLAQQRGLVRDPGGAVAARGCGGGIQRGGHRWPSFPVAGGLACSWASCLPVVSRLSNHVVKNGRGSTTATREESRFLRYRAAMTETSPSKAEKGPSSLRDPHHPYGHAGTGLPIGTAIFGTWITGRRREPAGSGRRSRARAPAVKAARADVGDGPASAPRSAGHRGRRRSRPADDRPAAAAPARAAGLTLDRGRRPRPSISASALSLIENGKREAKLSLLTTLAAALGTNLADLLTVAAPSRRAALEIELERAQRSAAFKALDIPAVRPGPRLQTEALESLVGLHRALARIQAERAATPEQARRANAELREGCAGRATTSARSRRWPPTC